MGEEVKIGSSRCKCKRCGHEWVRRVVGRMPVACPRCKRVDWARELRQKAHKGWSVWDK